MLIFLIDGWDFLIFQWSIDSIIKNHLRWSSQTHFKSRFALISSIFQCEQEVTPRIFDLSRFLWPVINDAERPFSAEDSSDWPVMLTDLVNIMDASWSKNQPLARFHRNGWSMLVISRIRNESIFSLFSIYRPLKGKSLKGNILDIFYNLLIIFHCGPSFKGHQICPCQAYGDVLALEHLINASARGGMKWQRWDREIVRSTGNEINELMVNNGCSI